MSGAYTQALANDAGARIRAANAEIAAAEATCKAARPTVVYALAADPDCLAFDVDLLTGPPLVGGAAWWEWVLVALVIGGALVERRDGRHLLRCDGKRYEAGELLRGDTPAAVRVVDLEARE